MSNYLNHRIFLILFLIMILSVFLLPNSSSALTISPIRFEIGSNPGTTVVEEVLLINENDTPETYYPSFANFEAQGDTGSPAFIDPVEGLGTWMTTDFSSVYLAPRQQKAVPFKINIPANAEPGGHFAVIFFGSTPPGEGGVSIGAKTGVLVLLSVNGEVREEAGLLDFNTTDNKFFYNTLPVSLEYRFKNDGGDRIKPLGLITIRNSLFIPTEKFDANPAEGNVLPGSTRKIKVDWVKYERSIDYVDQPSFIKKFKDDVYYQWKNFAVGLYSAKLDVEYGKLGERAKKTTFFFVFPWQLVLVMLVVFIIFFWGGKRLIKRYNRFIIEKAKVGTASPSSSSNDQFSI